MIDDTNTIELEGEPFALPEWDFIRAVLRDRVGPGVLSVTRERARHLLGEILQIALSNNPPKTADRITLAAHIAVCALLEYASVVLLEPRFAGRISLRPVVSTRVDNPSR
jgi:hypothetical protein